MPSTTVEDFPRIRLDRAEGGQSVAAPSGPGVSTRMWPFRIGASVANARTMVVSPPFTGPAIITNLSFAWGTAATTGVSFALYWGEDGSGQGQNLASAFRPSGTPIFEPNGFLTPAIANTEELREFFDQTQAGFVTPVPLSSDVRYYIPLAGQFFLKAMVRNGAAGTFDMKGIVSMIVGVPPDQIANFL
jgi:hypothetical protein